MKISDSELEALLNKKSIDQIAQGLGVKSESLRYRVRVAGISIRELNKARDSALIKGFHCLYTVKEMCEKTGFCKNKVLKLMRENKVLSKYSWRVA